MAARRSERDCRTVRLRDLLEVAAQTFARFRDLLPEAAPLRVDRHRLPNIWSLNFVIHGLLGDGVAASDRQDPQAKSLGEWLRARVVEVPENLLRG